jgi:hypothetical protein
MIILQIKSECGEHEINLHAETMNELIDEKLPKWLPNWEENAEFLRKCGKSESYLAKIKKEDDFWYYKK